MTKYLLKLYVTGKTKRTTDAIKNLKKICEETLMGEYELVVIDVLESPELAESDRILATPTLIRYLPPPIKQIIGDLSDEDKVIKGLDLEKIS